MSRSQPLEDITETLRGTRASPIAVSQLNEKICRRIEARHNHPIEGTHSYVFLDGIWPNRSWSSEAKNVAVLVAIGANAHDYREVPGAADVAFSTAASADGEGIPPGMPHAAPQPLPRSLRRSTITQRRQVAEGQGQVP